MDGYYPVLLEEDEEFYYPAPTIPHVRHVDYSKDTLSILLQLRPLILVNNILDGIIIEAKSRLEISQLLARRTLSIYPEHFALVNLIRKIGHGLSWYALTAGVEKR